MSTLAEQSQEVESSIHFQDPCWLFLTPNGLRHLSGVLNNLGKNPSDYLEKNPRGNLYRFKFSEVVIFFLRVPDFLRKEFLEDGAFHFTKPEIPDFR